MRNSSLSLVHRLFRHIAAGSHEKTYMKHEVVVVVEVKDVVLLTVVVDDCDVDVVVVDV